ncbi:hypothetical protein [Streptomyces shenzhenensis]|uniref:hypothetical protein n=1 Tax=Streptomyces shenzhenensis TaxID=943815 RepID=UPI0011C4203A|nr:hypothetical protein [Streptomyces shenzhenensis]
MTVIWKEGCGAMNHPSAADECGSVGGGSGPNHCSDLLDDFLDKIRKMESEYLSALDGTC